MMGDARKVTCLVPLITCILYHFCSTFFVKQHCYYGTQIWVSTNGDILQKRTENEGTQRGKDIVKKEHQRPTEGRWE
jgi:hypothetical protein